MLACEGTPGKTRTNSVADHRGGDIILIDSGRSTVNGKMTGDRGVVRSTSTIEGAWLFDMGIPLVDTLIRIDLLKAVAEATYDRSEDSGSASSEGAALANVSIAGVIDVPANTRIDIPASVT